MPKKKKRLAILDDALSYDDWQTLGDYFKILKPLASATIRLQGDVGKHGHV